LVQKRIVSVLIACLVALILAAAAVRIYRASTPGASTVEAMQKAMVDWDRAHGAPNQPAPRQPK
jgi:hypothetical protein